MLSRLNVDWDGNLAHVQPGSLHLQESQRNGANIKVGVGEDNKWAPSLTHPELCTIPFTWIEKRKGEDAKPPAGAAETYAKARGMWALPTRPSAHGFHVCQKKGLPQRRSTRTEGAGARAVHTDCLMLIAPFTLMFCDFTVLMCK